MAEANVHLELAHVTKRFGDAVAVDDVSFTVPRGAFATLLGPSGCGKTTTLRTIAGFYDPDAGDIRLAGKRINDLPAHRRGTAMVFQDYALFPHMTVRDNVAYGLRLARRSGDEVQRRVTETLTFVGLKGMEQRLPSQLLGGQQQRVAVARALVIEPQVLLLDEPLSNLDAKLREQLRSELRTLQQRLGMTFVYVTHDQGEALSLSDWIAVMKDGHVEQAGSPWEIYYRPRTAFLADFVGAVNLVPATVSALEDGRERVAFGSPAGRRCGCASVPRPSSSRAPRATAPSSRAPSRADRSSATACATGSPSTAGSGSSIRPTRARARRSTAAFRSRCGPSACTSSRMPSESIGAFVARQPAPLRPVVRRLRVLVRSALPELAEYVDRYGVLRYGATSGMRDWTCYISGHADHVNLGFARGASLPDPAGIVEGTGKDLRHVKLRSLDDVERPALARLLRDVATAERRRQ